MPPARRTRRARAIPASDRSGTEDLCVRLTRLTGRAVVLGLPTSEVAARRPQLHLLPFELRDGGPARAAGLPPVQALAVHLVTATARDALTAVEVLSDAANVVQREAGLLTDLTPPTATTWQALGARPRPAWLLLVPCQQAPTPPPAPPATAPLRTALGGLRRWRGQVVSRSGLPLPATISAPGMRQPLRTAADGTFTVVLAAADVPERWSVRCAAGQFDLAAVTDGDGDHIRLVIPHPAET